jgi:uncharacterized phage protein (TIGR01671 family)
MRPIRFRGKRLDNGEWVYGDLEIQRAKGKYLIHTYNEDGSYNRAFEVKNDTVGQFTGLQDRKGNDIYEGDIVRWEFEDSEFNTGWHGRTKFICDVSFSYGNFEISQYPYALGHCYDFDDEHSDLEVIGNIFDNPELLKGGEE